MNLKKLKQKLIREIRKNEDDEDLKQRVNTLEKVSTVAELMKWMGDDSWDLPSALSYLSTLNKMEKNDIRRGSCQDYTTRLASQLVEYYKVPSKCFDNWDT